MECSSELTKLPSICSEELSPTLLTDTQPEKPSEDLSLKEDSERSISKEFQLKPIKQLKLFWVNTESKLLKISSTKFTQ